MLMDNIAHTRATWHRHHFTDAITTTNCSTFAIAIIAIMQNAITSRAIACSIGLIRLPEHERPEERPGGALPQGWNNMPDAPATVR